MLFQSAWTKRFRSLETSLSSLIKPSQFGGSTAQDRWKSSPKRLNKSSGCNLTVPPHAVDLDSSKEVKPKSLKMKYPVNTANGDAGEFFFAYQIASVLKWPCRLFDIDIGIDAQVEVINDDRSSTGRFVAFQVKATSKEEKDCRYVSERQLAYWRELDLPVFVVLVDLSIGSMFLHRVDVSKRYTVTKKGSVRIDFDLLNDRFCADSGRVLAEAADEVALSHVRKCLAIVRGRAKEIREAISAQEDYPDPHALIELMDERYRFKEELAQATGVANALRAGGSEYVEAEEDLESALQELRDFMENWNMHRDWDDHGNITRFIDEER